MDFSKARDFYCIRMETDIKVVLKRANIMDMESFIGKMEIIIEDSIRKESDKVLEPWC